MYLYPQISVIELYNDSNGEKIDINEIPFVGQYEVNQLGEVYRLYINHADPNFDKALFHKALKYIEDNKLCVIDKAYIKYKQRGYQGIDFDSTFKTACLYVASAAAIAAPFLIAGYYTGINTGDWERAYRLSVLGISAGIFGGMGATLAIKEHFTKEMAGGCSE